MPEINWVCKHFNDLSAAELYTIMRVRSEVFVVEQNCVYLDADNKDLKCYHLCGYAGNELAAYSRLVPANISYKGLISIGRVLTSPAFRRAGAGKALMQKAIDETYRVFGQQSIKIGAQLYLKSFYNSFGFEQCSEVYDEDGIPHIEMLKK
jgi:ElaA protein